MSFSIYDQKPWLSEYKHDQSTNIEIQHNTVLEAFKEVLQAHPTTTILQYFDYAVSVQEFDEWTSALAKTLVAQGIKKHDRIGLYVQNNPVFVIALLAAWKTGAVIVPINPMNKVKELGYVLNNSGAKALICLDELYQEVVEPLLATEEVPTSLFLTCSSLDGQTQNNEILFAGQKRLQVPEGVLDVQEIIANAASINATLPALLPLSLSSQDTALLTYTSGTTGKPKGAMNTHGNIVFDAFAFTHWADLSVRDVNLATAPMFHITGMVAHAVVALITGCKLVLMHRFHPNVALEIIRTHKPTFTAGAITAYISLMNTGDIKPGDFDSFKTIISGGAPVSPTANADFYELTGKYIHNGYGLTETSSLALAVPIGKKAPVDAASSALSIGVPVQNTTARILDEEGKAVAIGEVGELAIKGPQVMKGYWQQLEATAETFVDGFLLTGDVGFMDEKGWFYLVDRKKDMINAGGYKVWPREVEDVMYTHPAIREVAVVGVPDGYRGETVKAVVSLKNGVSVTAEELIDYGRENMSSYKYPRIVEFMDELPKTNTGKILRRSVR